MMMYIYLALVLYVLVMVVLNLLEEKDLMKQVNAALVIIPLLLRILIIKIVLKVECNGYKIFV